MVFVCLGTHDMAFDRLLSMVEECIDSGLIKEEVIAQCGCTKYSGNKIKCFDYCPSDEMENYIQNASFIITHGGTGTIVSSLKMGKKVIAVNRLAKYKEHTTDHQIQIISEFVDTGYILGCYEGDNLADKINELSTFTPNVFVSNTDNVLAYLREYIDSVLNK